MRVSHGGAEVEMTNEAEVSPYDTSFVIMVLTWGVLVAIKRSFFKRVNSYIR